MSTMEQFRRAIIKDQYRSETTNYLGTLTQLFKQGVVRRQAPLGPASFQKTEKTWRACKACRGGRVRSKIHVTDQVSLERCHMCNGTGQVFG